VNKINPISNAGIGLTHFSSQRCRPRDHLEGKEGLVRSLLLLFQLYFTCSYQTFVTRARRHEERKAKLLTLRKKQTATRKVIFKRAEKYIKEYRALDKSQIQARRAAKDSGSLYVNPEPKLAIVIRIRGYVLFFLLAKPKLCWWWWW